MTHVRYPRFYVYTLVFAAATQETPFCLTLLAGACIRGLTGLQQSEGMFREGYTASALHREQNDRDRLPCPEASAVEAGTPGSVDMLTGDLGCGCYPCALPLPHGSSTGSPEWSLCTHLEPQLWQLQPKEQLQITWLQGQWGSHVWSHRTIYICIISKLLPDGLASRQPGLRVDRSQH